MAANMYNKEVPNPNVVNTNYEQTGHATSDETVLDAKQVGDPTTQGNLLITNGVSSTQDETTPHEQSV